jgi:hypothetical protein
VTSGVCAEKWFIQRIPYSQRYAVTTGGRRRSVLFTKNDTRIVNPSLADSVSLHFPPESTARSPSLGHGTRSGGLDDKIRLAAISASRDDSPREPGNRQAELVALGRDRRGRGASMTIRSPASRETWRSLGMHRVARSREVGGEPLRPRRCGRRSLERGCKWL